MAEALSGRVTDTIGDEFTTIRVLSTRNPAPYFVVDHGLPLPKQILIGTPNQPIAFEVRSVGRRGFVTQLSYTGRLAAGEPLLPIPVATLNSFDPTRVDNSDTLRLDRWSDSGRELLLGSQLAGARDGAFTTAAERSTLTLSVAPLLTVHAGGVEWTGAGPLDESRALFELLAARMARYLPGQVHAGVASAELGRMRARLQELEDTDLTIGEVPEEATEGTPVAPTVAASQRQVARASVASMAGSAAQSVTMPRPAAAAESRAEAACLVQGALLPRTQAPIAIRPVQQGAETLFLVSLFACPADAFAPFKGGIRAPVRA